MIATQLALVAPPFIPRPPMEPERKILYYHVNADGTVQMWHEVGGQREDIGVPFTPGPNWKRWLLLPFVTWPDGGSILFDEAVKC